MKIRRLFVYESLNVGREFQQGYFNTDTRIFAMEDENPRIGAIIVIALVLVATIRRRARLNINTSDSEYVSFRNLVSPWKRAKLRVRALIWEFSPKNLHNRPRSAEPTAPEMLPRRGPGIKGKLKI